jgi:hypothetical protein
MSKTVKFVLLVWGTIFVPGVALQVAAQGFQQTPCGIAFPRIRPIGTTGLTLVNGGSIVYDSNQQLCWLSDANPAGNPFIRALVPLKSSNPDGSTPVINPDGTMDYQTARNWVDSLNRFNNGKGWLDHNNWQFPTTQTTDYTCSSRKTGNFGVLCNGSALGNLYNTGLARVYPDSVVPSFFSIVWPFFNLQPGLYWTSSSQGDAGQSTFSFNTGDDGANTTNYNFLHVLPMTSDVLGITAFRGTSCSVVPYISGPGAGKAVFDSCTGLSWPIDGNLAAENKFDFNAAVVLDTQQGDPYVNHTAFPMTVPMIDQDGAMLYAAVDPCAPSSPANQCIPATSGWIVSMNNAKFAGSNHWMLPSAKGQGIPGDLDMLYRDLGLQPGDVRLEWQGFVGPFWRLQPGFYWSCERDDNTGSQAACNQALMPVNCQPNTPCPPFEYSFNFDDGFEGTDHLDKHFYVMVYFPAGQ